MSRYKDFPCTEEPQKYKERFVMLKFQGLTGKGIYSDKADTGEIIHNLVWDKGGRKQRETLAFWICRSFKLWLIKNQLRKKYAGQLKRNYELSINTVDGWNDSVRVGHSKILIDQGIEPTVENLQKFQEEVNTLVSELQLKYPPKPIPLTLRFGGSSNSGDQAAINAMDSGEKSISAAYNSIKKTVGPSDF